MIVVTDASVLVTALTRFDAEGRRLREWLSNLTDGGQVDIIRNFTKLECISALQRLSQTPHVSDEVAEDAIRNLALLPHRSHEITQPMAVRIWELRTNLSAYDAAYVALVERLMSVEGEAILATSDVQLASTPGLSIPVEVFT